MRAGDHIGGQGRGTDWAIILPALWLLYVLFIHFVLSSQAERHTAENRLCDRGGCFPDLVSPGLQEVPETW